MNIFPERLTALRVKQKLRQKDLAERLNVSAATISNYENAIRYPDIEMLVRIADYFGVSTDYMLGRTNLPSPASDLLGPCSIG